MNSNLGIASSTASGGVVAEFGDRRVMNKLT